MENEKILLELEQRFNELKQNNGLKGSLEEFDKAFFIRDAVLNEGFVSSQFAFQISSKVASFISSSVNFLHDLIMPNPSSLILSTEAKLFQNEADKQRIWKLMAEIMALERENHKAFVLRDVNAEVLFLDRAFVFYNQRLNPELLWVFGKIEDAWKGKK